MDAATIIDAVQHVTKDWCRQRKAEERHAASAARREEALIRCRRVTFREAAWEVMETAYMNASTNGQWPAYARQVMYAARGRIQKLTGKTVNDQYFCQTLLPDYLTEHTEETAGWDVVFDARGHFTEPHTRLIVPLGTIDVRQYLADVANHEVSELQVKLTGGTFPTCGPHHRFSAVLFIEKEGFMPLFQKAKLAERFDIAIMSTKGMSVTASRLLVDKLCAEYSIPLLVVRDFDKSGFSIAGTLQRPTRRYSFANTIKVIDLGLRLADVEQWGLESEDVLYGKSDPRPNLRANGATDKEIDFLCSAGDQWRGYRGRRVELNAFTSGDLIKWSEYKLEANGIAKVIPD